MVPSVTYLLHTIFVFYTSLSSIVNAAAAAETSVPKSAQIVRRGYSKGDLVPVTCLNRTIETGEHITDSLGNLQFIPFLTCNETGNQPLFFTYGTPETKTCTIETLSDELYHLLQYFVHSDVPLACRIPSYPLSHRDAFSNNVAGSTDAATVADTERWTPLTIALQGALQQSHLHLHTDINVLLHTDTDDATDAAQDGLSYDKPSHLIASTAYSLPNLTDSVSKAGTKIIATEPLKLNFNIGWIPGTVLPGMIIQETGKTYMGVTDYRSGSILLLAFVAGVSAGMGALAMLLYERKRTGRTMNGLLGGNTGVTGYAASNGVTPGRTGYGGYGGYSSYGGYSGPGKRD